MSFIKDDYIFIHIPKTGGVSVKQVLNQSLQSGHESLHQIATDGKDFFGTKYNPEYRVITCCRDPLKRFISAYYFCQQRHQELNLPDNIHQLIEEFPYRTDIKGWIHFRPMVEFVWMPKPAKVIVMKLENIDKDFHAIFGVKIPKANPFEHKTPRLKNSEKNIIKDYYKQDYINFNY